MDTCVFLYCDTVRIFAIFLQNFYGKEIPERISVFRNVCSKFPDENEEIKKEKKNLSKRIRVENFWMKTKKREKLGRKEKFPLLFLYYSDIEFKVFDEDQTKATRNKKKKTKKKKRKEN